MPLIVPPRRRRRMSTPVPAMATAASRSQSAVGLQSRLDRYRDLRRGGDELKHRMAVAAHLRCMRKPSNAFAYA